ncbi:MAG: RNA-binding protein [Myxococcales bacterium]|nr:RNA-binding protein [Myxococcales bacterium]
MNNRLYVGNLSFDATQEDLNQAFAEVGEVVEVKVIEDRDTGRSRGFGFVTMASPELAQQAIAKLDGTDLGGRALRVNIAEERNTRSGGGGYGGGGGGGNRGGSRQRW